ncbi:MAG: FeoB-associated Cys-rich membrane protein [Oscillospiraceae bacterium]|nr:FeoB-associated Cys-rich membrane protein [Oscillospiraceae bacterium]
MVLTAIVAAIIVSLNNDRRSGISSCGGSCGACPMHDKCHSAAIQNANKET